MEAREWMINENVDLEHLKNLEIFDFETTGRGVKTNKNIKPGEIILKIPLEYVMTGNWSKMTNPRKMTIIN